jgi:hypothetical protein
LTVERSVIGFQFACGSKGVSEAVKIAVAAPAKYATLNI